MEESDGDADAVDDALAHVETRKPQSIDPALVFRCAYVPEFAAAAGD